MALQPLNLATLNSTDAIVDDAGRPSNFFLRYLNGVIRSLQTSINGITAAQNAADAATAAATAANAAAAVAQAAAVTAGSGVALSNRGSALADSGITPVSVLSATPTLISVAAHVRKYADGTQASVNAGTVAASAIGAVDYVSYIDVPRTGGAVTYLRTATNPAQLGDTHVVGAVTIPGAGISPGGRGPSLPGEVMP